MFDDRSKKYKNQCPPLDPVDMSLYEEHLGKGFVDGMRALAKPLRNKVWAQVNATFEGGGVAEMLQGVLPIAKGLGIDARWFAIEGTEDFFTITKKFHNLLQGVSQPITKEDLFHTYLDTIEKNSRDADIFGHMVTIHDPQPTAMIMSGNVYGPAVWRCHIDSSNANLNVWRFLLPYINQYAGAIFTDPSFVRPGLQVPVYQVSPSIDPLRKKNRHRSRGEALSTLEPVFNEHSIDPERPIVLAISRYDIHKNQKGIIKAFQMMKKDVAKGTNPILIIMGNSASDDPEGNRIYEEIRAEAGNDKDIYLLLNVRNNDEVVGSLLTIADCFVHVSTKEGFGLVVTEALWQGLPVIGSRIGGIPQQVVDNKNGFLVEPSEHGRIAGHIKSLLEDRKMKDEFGRAAKEHVRENFLLPQMVKKHLILMRHLMEIDTKVPEFRINKTSYKETIQALYGRKDWPFSKDDLKKRIESRQKGPENITK